MHLPLITATPGPFHVMTKPIGPICNLDCKYCFYLEKEKLYPDERKWKMSDEVLDAYIRQYILSQPQREISFAWQGGEPTLLGVDYFRKVVALQQRYARDAGKTVTNAFQTNGTLLDDEWCEVFNAGNFLIGLSVDGPAELHDKYRVDKKGRPTFLYAFGDVEVADFFEALPGKEPSLKRTLTLESKNPPPALWFRDRESRLPVRFEGGKATIQVSYAW